jgi:hypothetical protein
VSYLTSIQEVRRVLTSPISSKPLLTKVYSGKQGGCMCGCRGNWTENNPSASKRLMTRVLQMFAHGEISNAFLRRDDQGNILHVVVETDTRTYGFYRD